MWEHRKRQRGEKIQKQECTDAFIFVACTPRISLYLCYYKIKPDTISIFRVLMVTLSYLYTIGESLQPTEDLKSVVIGQTDNKQI